MSKAERNKAKKMNLEETVYELKKRLRSWGRIEAHKRNIYYGAYKIAKQKHPDIVFHTDATQSIGKIDINIYSDEYNSIDFLSVSGHKVYAPKGIGILFSRTNISCFY